MPRVASDPYAWLQEYVPQLDERRRVELIDDVVHAALRGAPELAEPDLKADLVDFAAECLRSIAAVCIVPRNTWIDPGVPVAGLDLTRALARRGIDVLVLFKLFRTGHTRFWASIMAAVEHEIDDGAFRMRVLAVLWDRLARWMDAIIDRLVSVYQEERDRWLRGALARRAAVIEAILEGEEQDGERAGITLAHDLSPYQTGFTIRALERDGAGSGAGALEGIAAEFAAAAGASRALTIPSGAHAVWGWLATATPPDDAALRDLAGRWPQVRLSVGRPGRGIGGFRRSHDEAARAQQVADALRAPGTITLYRDVELLSLLSADPEGMQAFVASQLGSQITAARGSRRLLETALAFLEHNGNASAAARELGLHRNTIRNRLRRAEALLERKLAAPNVPLQLALQLQVRMSSTR